MKRYGMNESADEQAKEEDERRHRKSSKKSHKQQPDSDDDDRGKKPDPFDWKQKRFAVDVAEEAKRQKHYGGRWANLQL